VVRHLALVVSLNGGFCNAQLLLDNIRLYPQVGQLVADSLVLNAQRLTLLLAIPDVLLHHDGPLDGHVVLRLDVLQR
jgi:hypothetical protein